MLVPSQPFAATALVFNSSVVVSVSLVEPWVFSAAVVVVALVIKSHILGESVSHILVVKIFLVSPAVDALV